MENGNWGLHTVIDASGCDHAKITSREHIAKFAKDLVDRIDMKAYGEPQIIQFGEGDKLGYTLIQLIETSNITCHFVDELDEMYLDVFSCKDYNPAVVVDMVIERFGVKKVRVDVIDRTAPRGGEKTAEAA